MHRCTEYRAAGEPIGRVALPQVATSWRSRHWSAGEVNGRPQTIQAATTIVHFGGEKRTFVGVGKEPFWGTERSLSRGRKTSVSLRRFGQWLLDQCVLL